MAERKSYKDGGKGSEYIMANDKKYYYLKVKENFFDSEQMIILEAMQDGYLYSNILLKLYLKGDFYKRGYRIIVFNNYFRQDTYVKILSIYYHAAETVLASALTAFDSLGLVSVTEGGLILRDINVDIDRNRSSKIYVDWRNRIFERDKYTCSICGLSGVKVNAHHIKRWCSNIEDRYKLNNGTTLCLNCHKLLHKSGAK